MGNVDTLCFYASYWAVCLRAYDQNSAVFAIPDYEKGVELLSEFERLLLEATDGALVTTMGEPVARAMKFYLDVGMISKDIDSFRRQLKKFFAGSAAGSKLVEDKIMRNLADLMGASSALIPAESMADLKSFVENCRAEYVSST
jgi:hypothetical protein